MRYLLVLLLSSLSMAASRPVLGQAPRLSSAPEPDTSKSDASAGIAGHRELEDNVRAATLAAQNATDVTAWDEAQRQKRIAEIELDVWKASERRAGPASASTAHGPDRDDQSRASSSSSRQLMAQTVVVRAPATLEPAPEPDTPESRARARALLDQKLDELKTAGGAKAAPGATGTDGARPAALPTVEELEAEAQARREREQKAADDARQRVREEELKRANANVNANANADVSAMPAVTAAQEATPANPKPTREEAKRARALKAEQERQAKIAEDAAKAKAKEEARIQAQAEAAAKEEARQREKEEKARAREAKREAERQAKGKGAADKTAKPAVMTEPTPTKAPTVPPANSPPVLSGSREDQLRQLLDAYRAGAIPAAEYHRERARLLGR